MVWVRLGVLIAAPLILLALWKKDVIRPDSFSRRKPKRDVEGLPAPAWFGSAGILYLAPMLGATAVIGILGQAGSQSLSLREQGIMSLAAYGVGIATAIFLAYLIAPRVPAAGLKMSRGDVLKGFGCFLLAIPVIELVSVLGSIAYSWIVGDQPDAIAHETLRDIAGQPKNPWVWGVVFGAVIGAPVVEEFVFRVFLQSGLLRVTKSRWAAILISATLFALVHRIMLVPVPWHVIPVLFTLGAAMGLAFERTGRVLVPIVMHTTFNASSVAIVLLASS